VLGAYNDKRILLYENWKVNGQEWLKTDTIRQKLQKSQGWIGMEGIVLK